MEYLLVIMLYGGYRQGLAIHTERLPTAQVCEQVGKLSKNAITTHQGNKLLEETKTYYDFSHNYTCIEVPKD